MHPWVVLQPVPLLRAMTVAASITDEHNVHRVCDSSGSPMRTSGTALRESLAGCWGHLSLGNTSNADARPRGANRGCSKPTRASGSASAEETLGPWLCTLMLNVQAIVLTFLITYFIDFDL